MEIAEHPRIRRLNEEEASASYPGAFSTACHRSFLASWAIKDGKLYLIDVIGIYNLIGDELLFADWYSGTLEVQAGKMIRHPRVGYDSRHEREFEIEVKNGVVIKTKGKIYDESGRLTNPSPDDPPPYQGELPSWVRKR
ncbi:MAG: hypothetical protein Q7T25_13220 [Sideroxyarcus sp.]|nr:hypothetical protein [Sideroxyarcus sp.]